MRSHRKANKYLRFVVRPQSGPGIFQVTGKFDESWGWQINQGPAGYQRFKYIGFPANNVFRIELEDDGGVNVGFAIRFSTDDDDYSPNASGGIVVDSFTRSPNPT